MIKKKPKIYIGIDPAFRKNGFAMAVIDLTDRTINYKPFPSGFLSFLSWLLHDAPEVNEDVIFCVENSNLQNKTFDMTGTRLVLAKKSRDVGKNQATSQHVVDSCLAKGYKVLNISPKQKGPKWKSNKQLQQQLLINKIKASKKTSSQDERDAAKMAIIALSRWYQAE